MASDKITIASRGREGADLTLSSNCNLLFGSKLNTLISSGGATIIEAKNIYLGSQALPAEGSTTPGEQMVLGNILVEKLGKMIDAIGGIAAEMIPQVVQSAPFKQSSGFADLENMKEEFKQILSNFHYIEPNNDTKKQ